MRSSLVLALSLCALSQCALAGSYATALGNCLYRNASGSDKTVLTQWAFVTLGKTDAARQLTRIPTATNEAVTRQTKTVLTRLAGKNCRKEFTGVLLHETRDGLGNSVKALTDALLAEQIRRQASSVLSGLSGSGSGSETVGKTLNALGGLLKK